MIIKIDLKYLSSIKLNINSYLTLLKIDCLKQNMNITYDTTIEYITYLEQKGYLKSKNNDVILTDKGKDVLLGDNDEIDEIIDYFKEVTGKRKIDSKSISNRKFIKDRLDQGYTKEDLKAVIDLKYKEWNGTSMAKFVRIETLFNQTKFQKYIDEVETNIITPEPVNNVRRV